MLRSSRTSNGKALNALDFPMPFSNLPTDMPFSSELTAWRETLGRSFCRAADAFPFTTMRWGLCATSGAYHKLHCDCDGLGTFIKPQVGTKLWFLAVPKLNSGLDAFASIHLFLNDYDLDDTNTLHWDWEVVVLQPGMTLCVNILCSTAIFLLKYCNRIMRPNTPHAVVTPDNSICHGGHFYATSTLRDTCYGIFHSFVSGTLTTNTDHCLHAMQLLARMVVYYHQHFVICANRSDIASTDSGMINHSTLTDAYPAHRLFKICLTFLT